MNFNKPTGTFETQGDFIKAWEKEVEKELNEYPKTLSWLLEETNIKCPNCNENLYRCYVNDPYTQKLYGEYNLLYCATDKVFYNETNLTWVAIAGSGGGSGTMVYVSNGVLTIRDPE